MLGAMSSSDGNSPVGPPPPAYVVFGSDALLRRQAIDRIIERVLGDARDQMTLADFDGDSAQLANVLDECRTASLLAPVRLVIVRDADGFVTAHREALEKYLQAPCPTGVLALVCKSWPRTTRLYKLVEKIGGNIPCETPKGAAVSGWASRYAEEAYGCRLDGAAARRLVDLVGPQLGLLDMELSKLAIYVHPRKQIALADVEVLVGASRLETVFAMVEAIAMKDARGALGLWDQVISGDRDAEYRAVGGMAYALRRLAEAKRLTEQGIPIAQAAKQAGIWTDPGRLGAQLGRFSLRQWRDHLVQLLKIDVAAKTGLSEVRSSVEKLIAQWCAAA